MKLGTLHIGLVLCAASLLMGSRSTSLYAQDPAQLIRGHRFSDAIAVLTEKQKMETTLPQSDLALLGWAYLQRAHLLLDLANMQVEIGRDFYQYRVSSSYFRKVAYAPFFLGRYLFEEAEFEQALKQFDQAARNKQLPGEFRSKASIWAGASLYRMGRKAEASQKWNSVTLHNQSILQAEMAYARWWVGADAEASIDKDPSPSISLTRNQLWFAAHNRHIEDLPPLRSLLLNDRSPDAEHRVNKRLALRFYDPSTIQMLAYADFRDARAIFHQIRDGKLVDDAHFYAGVSAFEMGYDLWAERDFARTKNLKKDIYLGAIAWKAGQKDRARQLWKTVRGADRMLWAEVVALHCPEESTAVLNLYQARKEALPRRTGQALSLGRALVRLGRFEEGLRVLDRAYPKQYHNQVQHIAPAYLAVIAHAKFGVHRRRSTEFLGHMVALAQAFPVALNVLDMAQAYLMPDPTAPTHQRTGIP